MITITLEDAVRYAKEAAAEKPEGYIYVNPNGEVAGVEESTSCSYWDVRKGEPSCLVGHVLHRARVGSGFVNWKHSGSWFGSLAEHLNFQVEFEPDAWTFLSTVQTRQDRGTPWNEAIRIAEERVKDL